MNASQYSISLDLHHAVAPHVLPIKQGDTVRELKVTLVEDGSPYEVTPECVVNLIARLPDGTEDAVTMGKSHNVVSASIPVKWTENAGQIECEVRIASHNSGGQSLASPRFSLIVTEALLNNPYKVYWDRAATPVIRATQYVAVKDANFSVTVGVGTAVSAEYAWVLVPAEIIPETGVYVAATNGVSFAYVDEEEYTYDGKTVLYKRYRSNGTIATSIRPLVIFKEK